MSEGGMDNPQVPQGDIFEQAKEIVEERFKRPIGVDAVKLATGEELLPSLDLREVETGDIIWWKNERGTSNYYLLVRDREKDNPEAAIKGRLKAFDENGNIKREYQNIVLSGGAVLMSESMVMDKKLMKGRGVSLQVPYDPGKPDTPPKDIVTSPIAGMGIIKTTNPQA